MEDRDKVSDLQNYNESGLEDLTFAGVKSHLASRKYNHAER